MARMAVRPDTKEKNKDAELEEIDVAFLEDWGVSYSNILQFLYVCYIIAMKQQKSVIEMEESQLIDVYTRQPANGKPNLRFCIPLFPLLLPVRCLSYLLPLYASKIPLPYLVSKGTINN